VRPKKAGAIIAAAIAFALSACTPSAGSEGKSETLVLGTTQVPASLDPSTAAWGPQSAFQQAVYDQLLRATPEGTIEPFLATAWEYNADNTVLTLTIRKDVKFTDGSVLTADVVRANLEHAQSSSGPGAKAYKGASFQVPDETTVVITLAQPDPGLIPALATGLGYIASANALSDPNIATKPVGSGPYVLDPETTVFGTTYHYKKNPDYWAPELQHYNQLIVNAYTDASAVVNAIKAGEVDVARLATAATVADVEASGWTINRVEYDVHGLWFLDRGGSANPALADVRVRQAINYALNRPALLKAIQLGEGTVTQQVFPPRSTAFDEKLDETYPYDPEKARKLLAEAGYPNGFSLLMPLRPAIGQAPFTLIAQQLADVGITAEYRDSGPNMVADIQAAKYPAGFYPLGMGSDWQIMESLLYADGGQNPYHFSDPQVEELIASARAGDSTEQSHAARLLNEYVVKEAWFAPFYRGAAFVASNPETSVKMLPTNVFPSLYDIKPAS
jgi:peptide/nickel transport system substrate-binding protein